MVYRGFYHLDPKGENLKVEVSYIRLDDPYYGMWDYIAFFGYNFIFFLFGLFVWYVFPRPTPYDYTTIPGLKRDPNAADGNEGNSAEMKESGNLGSFLDQLHDDYGPLASFYWGKQYVVAVGSLHLWHDLVQWNGKILATVDIIPISTEKPSVSDEKPAMIASDQFGEVTRRMNGDFESDWWLLAVSLINACSNDEQLDVNNAQVDRLKAIIRSYEEALFSTSYADGMDSTREELRTAMLCQAMQRICQSVTKFLRSNGLAMEQLRRDLDNFGASPLADWPADSYLRSVTLEAIRLAVPFDYVFYVFNEEIDLDGHPIPAGVPIVLRMKDVSIKRVGIKESSKFDVTRFVKNSTKIHQLRDCLLKLPFVDHLASAAVTVVRLINSSSNAST